MNIPTFILFVAVFMFSAMMLWFNMKANTNQLKIFALFFSYVGISLQIVILIDAVFNFGMF